MQVERNFENNSYVFRIDKFRVPASARAELLEIVHSTHQLLRTLPGFVEDFLLEQTNGGATANLLTIAVWENRQAFDSAGTLVQQRYREIGFHPAELHRRLGIEADLAVYTALND